MKYIKKYEENDINYNEGDYVILNLDAIRIENDKNNFSKIPSSNIGIIILKNRNMAYPYLIQTSDKNTFVIKKEEILRLANLKEIEAYKLKEDTNKYNL